MSKKSRLRAEKAKQLEAQRNNELEEIKLKKNGAKQSKSLKKFVNSEPTIYRVLKIIMLFPLAVNAIYFGGITVIASLINEISLSNVKTGCLITGIILLCASVACAFFRKYIISFLFSATGTILYLYTGLSMISYVKDRLENYAVEDKLKNMDTKYELYFLPILVLTACSTALLVVKIVSVAVKKKRRRDEFNNSPVKSIIE